MTDMKRLHACYDPTFQTELTAQTVRQKQVTGAFMFTSIHFSEGLRAEFKEG